LRAFSTPLAAALILASGLARTAWLALCVSLLLRWLVAWSVSGYTHDRESQRWLFWLPMRDLLTALIWFVGLFGRHVTWRGETYSLDPDGRIRVQVRAAKASLGERQP